MGATSRWSNDVLFVWWENTLTECLGNVTTLWNAAHVSGERDEEAHLGLAEDGGEAVRLFPWVAIEVAEDDNSIFAALWVAVFVTFDFGDGHGGKGLAGDGSETEILGFSNDLPGLKIY